MAERNLFSGFCQKITVTLVCKEITSVDLNDKTTVSLQPNVPPGHYEFKVTSKRH